MCTLLAIMCPIGRNLTGAQNNAIMLYHGVGDLLEYIYILGHPIKHYIIASHNACIIYFLQFKLLISYCVHQICFVVL